MVKLQSINPLIHESPSGCSVRRHGQRPAASIQYQTHRSAPHLPLDRFSGACPAIKPALGFHGDCRGPSFAERKQSNVPEQNLAGLIEIAGTNGVPESWLAGLPV